MFAKLLAAFACSLFLAFIAYALVPFERAVSRPAVDLNSVHDQRWFREFVPQSNRGTKAEGIVEYQLALTGLRSSLIPTLLKSRVSYGWPVPCLSLFASIDLWSLGDINYKPRIVGDTALQTQGLSIPWNLDITNLAISAVPWFILFSILDWAWRRRNTLPKNRQFACRRCGSIDFMRSGVCGECGPEQSEANFHVNRSAFLGLVVIALCCVWIHSAFLSAGVSWTWVHTKIRQQVLTLQKAGPFEHDVPVQVSIGQSLSVRGLVDVDGNTHNAEYASYLHARVSRQMWKHDVVAEVAVGWPLRSHSVVVMLNGPVVFVPPGGGGWMIGGVVVPGLIRPVEFIGNLTVWVTALCLLGRVCALVKRKVINWLRA